MASERCQQTQDMPNMRLAVCQTAIAFCLELDAFANESCTINSVSAQIDALSTNMWGFAIP